MAKTFEEWWSKNAARMFVQPLCFDAWHARDPEIATLTAERDALLKADERRARDITRLTIERDDLRGKLERVKGLLDGFDPFQAGRDGDDCIWCRRSRNTNKIDTWQKSRDPEFHDTDCEFILTLAALQEDGQ